MSTVKNEGLTYVIGLIRNEELLSQAHGRYQETQQKQRLFAEGLYQAKSWDIERRVILKAEWWPQGPISRFVVTNLCMDTVPLVQIEPSRAWVPFDAFGALDESGFEAQYGWTPLERPGLPGMRRNSAIAARNAGEGTDDGSDQAS